MYKTRPVVCYNAPAMSTHIKVKGIRDGLLITIGDGNWPDLKQELLQHLESQADFLKGANLTLDVGNHILHAAEMGKLRDIISEMDVSLKAILSSSPKTERNAQSLGLGTRISKPHPERIARPLDTHVKEGEPGILIQRTLRSGYKIEHPGHITVIGDVNPGAEIIAGGSIVIWGRLRGMVHAGAEGNEEAYVCALDLSPTQLRLAGQIAISPSRKKWKASPEIAFIRDGQVVAEPWDTKK